MARRLVDQLQHRPRDVEPLGDAIQEVLVEHFPAQRPPHLLGDLAGPRPRFSRNRDEIAGRGVRLVDAPRRVRGLGDLLRQRPGPHLALRSSDDLRVFTGLLFHG